MSEPRRARLYWLPEYAVLDAFRRRWDLPDAIRLCFADLPEGARIARVHHDWSRKCFGFVVCHESFPEWRDGEECPPGPMLDHEVVGVEKRCGDLQAYEALLRENEILRGIFGDLCNDDARVRRAYLLGRMQGYAGMPSAASATADELGRLARAMRLAEGASNLTPPPDAEREDS